MPDERDTLQEGLMVEIYEAVRRRVESPMIVVSPVNKAILSISITIPGAHKPKRYYLSLEEV